MKNYFLFIVLLAVLSCKQGHKNEPVSNRVDTFPSLHPDSLVNKFADRHYFWESDLDTKEGLIVKRTSAASKDSLGPALVVARMNERFPEIPLRLAGISNDTIFVKVTNSRYLTEQMGSSGPEAYIADLVYNLTEAGSARYIHIDFKTRDHGAPGTYSRTDFIMR